ncbi:hypothetical protein GCM10010293_39920 [Streptomyces griseoflavus]|uniref:hypothetical protein n=1 Tax=Streptomyces griseoflavus TaxID=35619 RepID=UPI00167D6F13|nr:hypothetical protein [Streptomyces griseoflavus]GGV36581.1 hypothetical protein GCM10010293_39920 [Streptomyces griseoflavus]
MTRRIADLDVPLSTLQEQVADLVARQREEQADRSAKRLREFLAPTTIEEDQ